ncbi:hypothetical protein MARA_01470 (plasmid) [Mycolicibacterium arabiense]|uniref:Uncharacterized protein n=1 Tax=Mycolicibacterium arabiense TaxID=1286181 RepID=A0A7I7RQB4_9MYCO|nr:hypothetical protein MARA_01470 [Mycolicibacterium arabiense]
MRIIPDMRLVSAIGIALAPVVALSATGTANAAIGAGRVQLCAQGNYAARLQFYDNSDGDYGAGSATVQAGTCYTFDAPHSGGQPTPVYVIGINRISLKEFTVPGGPFKSYRDSGAKLAALGTPANATPVNTSAVQYPNR